MSKHFETAYALSRISEGGYVNHPEDNGGPTNYGVTQRVYDKYRQSRKLELVDVRFIKQDEVRDIYKTGYWDAVQGDKLPPGVSYAVFDAALTGGPRRAVVFLQRAVGVNVVDGVLGPVTLAAVGRMEPKKVIEAVCNYRLAHMKGLSDWQHFGKGWLARVNKVRDEAITLSG